jgi:hypothetical protein
MSTAGWSDPMELERKKEFVLSTVRPMAVFTFPFLAQLYCGITPQRGEALGSGHFCELNGREVIVTALHVVRKGLKNCSYLAVSGQTGDQSGRARPYQIHGRVRPSDATDLAILPLPDDFPRGTDVRFWPEGRIDIDADRLSSDFLFVHGFPGVQSHTLNLPIDARVVSKSLPYGVMQRLEDLPDDLKPHQFAMDFDMTRCQVERDVPPVSALFDENSHGPEGLSGSPVWRIGASGLRAAEWTPQCANLVGIVTGWNPEKRVLIATRASSLLELASAGPSPTAKV